MSTGPTASSASWIKGVLRMFESQGVDIARLLRSAQIAPEVLDDPHARLGVEPVNQLWRLAVEASGQEALGMDRELAGHYIDLEVAAAWVGSEATLGSVLQSQASYTALIGDASAFTIDGQHPDAWVTLKHGNDNSFPRQRMEFMMLAIVLVAQRIVRRPLRPLAVEFVFPEPLDVHRHRMAFPCPLRFDRPANRLLLSGDDLVLPVVSGSASQFVLEERVLESLLARLGAARTSFRVAQELVRRLRRSEPLGGPVAASIGMSEALLAKQLRAERTSLEDLLDQVQREMAHEYLAGSDAPLGGMPGWLGMSETGFVDASRRWFGQAPADYRRDHGPDVPRS